MDRVGLLALCFLLSGAGDAPHASAAPEHNPPPAIFALPDIPLPRTSPEARAVTALAGGDNEGARRIVQAALSSAHEPSLGRLRWLYAKATQDIGDARVALEALANSGHPLAGWARLRMTERLRDRDPNAAVTSAETLMTDPRFRARGEQLLALSLFAAGRYVEAEPMLRSLVADVPEKSSALGWAMPLAAILANKPDKGSRQQALALYRRVQTRAPLTPTAEQARNLIESLLSRFPPEERKALAPLSADDAFIEAQAMLDGREYTRAANSFEALAQRFQGDPIIVCDAKLGRAKAFLAANKKDAALIVFDQITRDCHGADALANAHYLAGRIHLRRGETTQAIDDYSAVAREFPKHPLADDALLAEASAFQDLGDNASARASLTLLLQIAPHGDMRPDARFALAWLERSEHHYDAALAQLSKLIAEGPGEQGEDMVGRASYWQARTLLDRGDRAAAQAGFVALINAQPLTYYAQQALARLGELDAAAASALIASMRDDTQRSAGLRIEARPEVQGREFQTAIELMRVGESGAAIDELEALGCFRSGSADDLYLLAPALLQEFGAQPQAVQMARRRVTNVLRRTPKGSALALYRVVFPRAYRPLLDDIAQQTNVPAAFVRAVAREESSFDTTAVSRANAYGLIQLIRPTAKAYGKPLGLRSDPNSLKQPEINLRIGTRFMHELFERYKDNPALVPSAYNAGPGATDRWLRERPNLALDEWIETIPYTETRRYTRRVLQSYGVYAWLDEGRVPALPLALPRL
jgi:soluble lytic murein transglycosylase